MKGEQLPTPAEVLQADYLFQKSAKGLDAYHRMFAGYWAVWQ